MTKAKAKPTTFDNADIQRAGREFDRLVPSLVVAERKQCRFYKKFLPHYDKIQKKYKDVNTNTPKHKTLFARRRAEINRAMKSTGYSDARRPYERLHWRLSTLSEAIIKMRPHTLADMAVMVRAYDFENYDGWIDCEEEDQNFALRFANFVGVKLIRNQ